MRYAAAAGSVRLHSSPVLTYCVSPPNDSSRVVSPEVWVRRVMTSLVLSAGSAPPVPVSLSAQVYQRYPVLQSKHASALAMLPPSATLEEA